MADLDHALLRDVSENRAAGAQIIFPLRHPQESGEYHIAMMSLWGSRNEFVMFEAFREAGKTTTAEEFLLLEGAFGNFNYGLVLGETFTKACNRLEAIDKEARSNPLLHRLFGGPILARKSIENRVYFRSGALLEAWGWEQELQSFKYHEHRPDMAYLDDIENQERVRDTAAVDNSMRKLYLELIPAMDKTRRRIRYGQTRRAEDCMVTRLKNNAEWLYYGVPICDGDIDAPTTRSNWPARYPMEWIRKERDSYAANGMLGEFNQSYMLQVTDPEKKPFKEAMLKAIDVAPWGWMPRYAIFDPSRTNNTERTRTRGKSDRYGKVVVSRMGTKILVHESSGDHRDPNEFVDDIFATTERHRPAKVGVEKNSLDDWIMQPIRLEMLRRGMSVPLVALQAPQDRSKEDFILGLKPFATAGDIVLVGGKGQHPQLVAEWCNFPSGTRDVMNALAYSIRMFSGMGVYSDFGTQHVADAPRPRGGEDVHLAIGGSGSEVVAAAMLTTGRRLAIARDWVIAGATNDAIRTLAAEIRMAFPHGQLDAWVPAEVYDQGARIPIVEALRVNRIQAKRAEPARASRGILADRMRMVGTYNLRNFTIDARAQSTINAFAGGYCYPVIAGGRQGVEPEEGTSRRLAEAIESMVAMLDRLGDVSALPAGANLSHTPGGQTYITSNPNARRT